MKSTVPHMVPLNSNDAATGSNACDGIALPLLGSNQDSPDPESRIASVEDLCSGRLRVFTVNLGALARSSTPPAPAQGPHSHDPAHGSGTAIPPCLVCDDTGLWVARGAGSTLLRCGCAPRDPSPHRFQEPVP